MVIAKQANVTTGPQQVNNGVPAPSRVRETEIEPNKLWRAAMANGWTPERQARQAQLIRRWKPWERSTGPTTAKGKARVSRNAYKGGTRALLRELARILRR
jgi:hypothetical protein